MYREISLNGLWELRDEPLSHPLSDAPRLTTTSEGWISQPVPGDIHQGLMMAGRIEEPLVGLNSFDCAWTEHRSWWFRRVFDVPSEWLEADVLELEMNGLDANGEVFINGVHIGSHHSAFRPFVRDVKALLEPGENVLLVRLTAGVETVSELDMDHCDGVRASTEAGNGRPNRGDPRRIFARKPQYTWGWDWSPRLPTTAIGGDVKLRVMETACIRDVSLRPVQHGDDVFVTATVLVDQFHYYRTREGWVGVTIVDADGSEFSAEARVLLRSGYNHVKLRVPITEARLWWPNGLGEQHLYRVRAELTIDGQTSAFPEFRYGLRFVALDTDDAFAFIINGRRIYVKGANWIPADALYARVTDETYDALVRQARDANFNMLRIWGGGLYERAAFYEACDRHGIMVWHDFMFACAPYPDDLPAFQVEVEKEADYQTKRLRNHPSVVLWCGNNENTWGFVDWWDERTRCGAYLYNYLLPEVVARNCPDTPYWNSSPYGGETPNASDVGDRHHWNDCMMNPDMTKRITPEAYDLCDARFVSEFGYVGAPPKATVLEYLGGAHFDRTGEVWQHHTNTFEKNTVDAGIRKHYVDPDTLSPDDYLLYSGLVQGLMYAYALDSMRGRTNCHGSLFWMFEDCWGEVGWTIVDYARRRKPAWYFVRRAYAPLRLIARPAEEEGIRVVLANGTSEPVDLELEVGYVSLDGSIRDLRTVSASSPALQRTEVARFDKAGHDPTQGLWIARVPGRAEIPTATLRACDYRELAIEPCDLDVDLVEMTDRRCVLRISSEVYAHAVHFALPPGALPSDSYFDLLPGEARDVVIASPHALDPDAVGVHCVNGV
ncbi:MAG: glycosyl hydrolase 2 galactose-binding domain-containing protein [Anaerolineae bacterium]